MSHLHTASTARARRLRPSAVALHGGASSMLRLSQPAAQRLPSGSALDDWVQRAASALQSLEMVAVPDDAPADLVTALWPSDGLQTGWR